MAYNDKKMIEDINGDLPPQYFNNAQNRYEDLRGADGVSFVGNHVLTESGIWVPQKGSDDGAAHMQVTGSNVEKRVVIDSLSITDTSTFSKSIDTSDFNHFSVFVKNTHDVSVQFVYTPGIVNSHFWDTETGKWDRRTSTTNTVEVPPSNAPDLYNITDFFTEYKGVGFDSINVRGKAKETPSSGYIECYILGVRN